MGVKFNPPPGWPVPWGFDPPPGWEPDPAWPAPPPGWPLWIGKDPSRNASLGRGSAAHLYGSRTEPRYLGQEAPWFSPQGTSPGYPAPGYGYDPGYRPSAVQSTDGFAIASFVLSLFGAIPLSVTFGIIALRRIRRRPRHGRELAITGLVISSAWLAFLLTAVVAGLVASTARVAASPGSGHALDHSGNKQVSVLSLRAGDCLQSPSLARLARGVSAVTAVPCSTPHNAQIFVQFRASGGSYPGRKALVSQATAGCQARLAASVIRSRIKPRMRVEFFFPQPVVWLAGRRAITCVILNPSHDLRLSLVKARRLH
jgi:hypothetical protein